MARRRFVAAVLVAVLAPMALWGWLAAETRLSTLRAAQEDARRVTEALGQNTLKLLESQALMLDLVRREAGTRDCAALRADAPLGTLLVIAARRSPDTNGLWVTDAHGVECDASDPALIASHSLSFRDYFRGARALGAGRYFVDRAVFGLVDHHPVFNIATARARSGTFNGVVVAAVNLTRLREYWHKTISDDPTSRVALYRQDGATIARSWTPLVPNATPADDRRIAALWGKAPEGTAVCRSPADGMRRIVAWRTLPAWGVVVTSSVSELAVLIPWRRAILFDGVFAAVASILLGALAWLLLRAQGRLARMVAERTRALRISEERLSLFIDRAPAAIAMFDTEMHYLAASRRYLADYGLPYADPAELIGRRHDEIVPQQPDSWRGLYRRVIAGETLGAEDDPLARPDGRTERLRWEMGPWYQADGTVGGAVLFSEIVTARKQIEQVLARDRAELEGLVAERTRDLAAAQARLAHAQRMEALGQLAGGIAHDFNNVIQAVQAAAALIERRPDDAERVRTLARMSTEAAERAAGITRRLLAFSRRGDLRAEPVEVAALLAGMQEILAHTLGAAISVQAAAPPGLPPLLADKAQLETVLINLATNARDAMPGGGTLTLSAALVTAHGNGAADLPHGLAPGTYLRLAVTDTGTGMNPEVLARASEPFFTTKGVGRGTGLGLAMARGFAEQSGGGLAIASTQGVGTTVALVLPVAAGAAAPAKVIGPAIVPGAARARLLMVDDDTVVRETLAQQMEEAGYDVQTAPDGAAALALLDAGAAADLLVTDLAMPGMDGLTLLQETRRRRPGLPGILLTGYATDATDTALDQAISGAVTLLRKPIDGATLAARIAVALQAAARSEGTLPT